MVERPLLLLDVDGVLNPLGGKMRNFVTRECVVDGVPYRVHLSPAHGRKLLALAVETGAELVWATTWEHAANEWIGPCIGLPALPVIEMPALDRANQGEMFKTPHIAAYAGRRPFVWFDDLTWEADVEFLRLHPGVDEFLLVHVDPRCGLTDDDLDQARTWLSKRSG
ncbi:HAD domain-containing protein [Streptosporangium soli]|nr:HAD domain-containing protein [Streptosporangium sp. KLBMP 9127]